MIRSARFRLVLAAGMVCAPVALVAQNARPENHTVKQGDTLWDLSRQYLGDPLLWPEIYRLNTNIVEDPHWIYPGQVLRLAGGAEVSAVPATETPAPPTAVSESTATATAANPAPAAPEAAAPAEAAAPSAAADTTAQPALAEPQVGDLAAEDTSSDNRDDVDLTPLVGERGKVTQVGPSLEISLRRQYRSLRRSEFYSSGFLTEGQALPYGRLLGTVTPLAIDEVSNQSTAHRFGQVAVMPPPGGRYRVGDTLLAVIVQREIPGFGNVIIPTGLLQVVDVSRPENLAEVLALYGPVHDHQSVLPAENYTDPGHARPAPISDGVRAHVIANRDQEPLTGLQDVVFLDKGRRDGVALGDVFELRQEPRPRPGAASVISQTMASVQVVHLGDHTATARVVSVFQPDIPPGTEARQVAKLPT